MTIADSIDPKFIDSIMDAISQVHPQFRLNNIEISTPGYLLAIGKNALVQAKILIERYPDLIHGGRVHQISGYETNGTELDNVDVLLLPHPFPSEKTFEETEKTLDLISELDENDTLYILITGGGSAAFAIPEEHISSTQYLEILRLAMAAGYSIHELNQIRSIIDKVKGGKLLNFLDGQSIMGYITSDVVTDDPKVVASGPTASGLDLDPAVVNWLSRLFVSLEVQTEIDFLIEKLESTYSGTVENTIITTRMDLIRTIQNKIEDLGYTTVVADASLEGSIEEVKSQIIQLVNQFESFSKRMFIWTGEPSITLTTQALSQGKGGRISALSCLIADELRDFPNVSFLGLATDGKDGSSPSAGYLIDQDTSKHLRPLGGANKLIRDGNSGMALTSLKYGINLDGSDVNLLDLYLVIIRS